MPAGFFLPDGYEFVLTLLAATTALALTGPGALALDEVLFRREDSGVGREDERRGRAAA